MEGREKAGLPAGRQQRKGKGKSAKEVKSEGSRHAMWVPCSKHSSHNSLPKGPLFPAEANIWSFQARAAEHCARGLGNQGTLQLWQPLLRKLENLKRG